MSTNRVEKFTFSVNFTRPHENNSVAFSDFSTLESDYKSLHFIENDTLFSCGRENGNATTSSFTNETWRIREDGALITYSDYIAHTV